MAWEECLANLKNSLKPKQVVDIETVDWNSISEDALDGNTFKDGDPFFLACQGRHCTEDVNQTPIEHSVCRCEDINGKPIPNCKPPSYLYPLKASVCVNIKTREFNGLSGRKCTNQGDRVSWYELACYCCCSCFANGTSIAIPDGSKVIEQFSIGDQVLTADVTKSGTGINLNWSTASVSFSSGTGPDGHQPSMVFIRHGRVGSIVVTTDHLFLMPNGKLKRANRLVPGVDFLVSAEGVPVEINEVSLGEYRGGVHHIATDKEFTGDISGHLLISEGVVSGDFNLQIHAAQLKESHFVDDHDDLPTIGQPEYLQANSHLVSGDYRTFMVSNNADQDQIVPHTRKFFVHGLHSTDIPDAAAKFVSDEQAADLANNATMYDFVEVAASSAAVQYALRLFQGFYPNITFYHDVGNLDVNGYAFTQYGKQIVVLAGGLTRIKGLGREGLAVILSHLVARLQKSPPRDGNGFTSVAMADYYSTGILRTVFFGNMYTQTFTSGTKQVAEYIFDNFEEANDRYAGDPFEPTRETRMESFQAGDAMTFPPEEAGGPVNGGLEVTGAKALPPTLTPAAFTTEDISAEMAEAVYTALQQNKIVSETGVLADDFALSTDLSFLFADVAANLKALLTEEVRYILLHAGATVDVSFNIPASNIGEPSVYRLEPETSIRSVQVSKDNLSAVLTAKLQKNVEYTLTVAKAAKGEDGSTLDPTKRTAAFTLA